MRHLHHLAPVHVHYRPELAVAADPAGNFSKSPSKPRRFVEHLNTTVLASHVEFRDDFAPVTEAQLCTAHSERYVRAFFEGNEPLACSNGLSWTADFADSVRYTNGSLLAAVRGALASPERIALSPTSGFHHARPERGGGFCTFSGQVIAALDVYGSSGARGAWVDLDGHFGNSIEDSRRYAPELDLALPRDCHLNPGGSGATYLAELRRGLAVITGRLLAGELEYVAFAHGADSHVWDDLGGQCTTAEWLEAARLVYRCVADVSCRLGRPVPLVLALFGGYRDDHPASVLELHCADLAIALRELTGTAVDFEPTVSPKGGRPALSEEVQEPNAG